MTDTNDPQATDETWQVEVDHSSYYRWVPVKDEDVTDTDLVVDATWPGFHLKRVVVDEPTTSTTGVHVPSMRSENDDRRAAGLAARPDATNLAVHLADGPWPKHFPLESITAIRCSDPGVEAVLRAYFGVTA